MSDTYLAKCSSPSELSEEPTLEYTDEPPTDTTPLETMHQETSLAMGSGEFTVESQMPKDSQMMCVTTNGGLMVIAWTIASMLFSQLGAYWFVSTFPAFHIYEYLIASFYPMSAVLVVVLLLSPVFAVVGDVRYGNFRLLLSAVIPLNVFGLVILVVLGVAFYFSLNTVISYCFVVGYVLVLLAGGIFQTNAIQLGRDVLGDLNSPERSTFVHWYYWATYVPTFVFGVICGSLIWSSSMTVPTVLDVVLLIAMIALLIFLLVTCIVHCVRLRTLSSQNIVLPRITENPVTQVSRVTRYALQSPTSPGRRGFLVRLNNVRRSNGGLANDEDVDNVVNFWLLVLLMVSLYGFFFWDDMWAAPFVNAINDDSNLILWVLSSQAATATVVFISVPIYQLVMRPLLGIVSSPFLWRIFAGLILQLISLAIVTWNGAATRKIGSEVLSDACNLVSNGEFSDGAPPGEGVNWFILAIPQGINGISQLLVFPAVIELILTNAPRVMQGLLIGLWYAMHSIHVIVSVVETATCAVFYWQYYIMKIVLVVVSIIAFGVMAFFYKHNRVLCNGQRQQSVTYQELQEISSVENL